MENKEGGRTFGVVFIGASRFDHMPELDNEVFAGSKDAIAEVLTADYLVAGGVKSLDLFDRSLRPDDLVGEIKDFSEKHRDLTDVILYYCGHGSIRHPDIFCLLLRSSRRGQEATTTLKLADFQYDLRPELAGKRTFILLDCCYAAAAARDLMSGASLSPLIARQVEVAGTALFAAASVDSAAYAPRGEKVTLFSGHLVTAIRNGADELPDRELSLSLLAEHVRDRILQEPLHRRVMPELHTPKQVSGNVSLFPLFKNKASAQDRRIGAPGRTDAKKRSTDTLFNKRPNDIFVAYAPSDRAKAEPLVRWLGVIAGLQVASIAGTALLHDPGPGKVIAGLARARASIFCVSRHWLSCRSSQAEFADAEQQCEIDERYRVIVLRLDDCELPLFMASAFQLDMQLFDAVTATALLEALSPSPAPWTDGSRDIYFSLSWHAGESQLAQPVSTKLIQDHHFRLIGDSPDFKAFGEGTRLKRIMEGCGALVAVLPYRDDAANGFTSKWIVKEIELARSLERPYLMFAAEGIVLDEALTAAAFGHKAFPVPAATDDRLLAGIFESFEEDYRPSPRVPYSFLASSMRKDVDENYRAVSIVEQITSMKCVIGERLEAQHAQREIVSLIRNAEFMIADISGNNHNSLIEAGIARGTGTRLHLICAVPESGDLHTRFMFRDMEINWYADPTERVGIVHRIARAYRRRVITALM